jgi:hypothetical protein
VTCRALTVRRDLASTALRLVALEEVVMADDVNGPAWHEAEQGDSTPELSAFLVRLEDVETASYPGRCADVFFTHNGEGILKWLHYLPIYDRLFGNYTGRPIRFLEIGVLAGGSMQMWRRFFGPLATIFGIDINPKCAGCAGDAGQVRIGSQDDPDFLRAVVAEMGGVDIVLDDGSHIARHQRASFDVLFPLLNDGGLYVIEDLHTAYWPDYEGGLKRSGTGIEFLKDKIDTMHAHYFTKGANSAERIAPIASIQFFDSIAAIEKRQQTPRHLAISPCPK